MKRFSDKELIRKQKVRIIVFWIGIFLIILGIRSWDLFRNWLGLVVAFAGIAYLTYLINAYERLLEEK